MSTHGSAFGAVECEDFVAYSGESLEQGDSASSTRDVRYRLEGRSEDTDNVSDETLENGFVGDEGVWIEFELASGELTPL